MSDYHNKLTKQFVLSGFDSAVSVFVCLTCPNCHSQSGRSEIVGSNPFDFAPELYCGQCGEKLPLVSKSCTIHLNYGEKIR